MNTKKYAFGTVCLALIVGFCFLMMGAPIKDAAGFSALILLAGGIGWAWS